ncbi:MAG: hypothetical protein WC483_06590 [Candidatus Paceibacterota bacterium]
MTVEELREKLSNLEHEQWISWSKYTVRALKEAGYTQAAALLEAKYSPNWTPYAKLPEGMKAKDRIWADKIVDLLHELGLETCPDCMKMGDVCDGCSRKMPPKPGEG